MNFVPFLAGILALLAVGRHVATRRVSAGHGKWVWLVFGPTLSIGIFLLWVAGQVLVEDLMLGLALTIGGVLYLASLVMMIDAAARGVTAATTPDEVEIAISAPLSDYFLRQIGVVLIGGLVAVLALIIYGVIKVANQ